MIHTLIPDVYELLERKDGWFTDGLSKELSREVGGRLQTSFNQEPRSPTLRLSQMGPKCPRALWHSIHTPELAEPLPPWATFKYSYGHIIEGLAITLAKAAGHKVTGEQDELVLDGIVGHRDCVIDGYIVDVKSASSRMFEKFKTQSISRDDPFGYLDQLDGYILASAMDDSVRYKSRGYLWVIDKTLGHMVLYEHELREQHIKDRIKEYKRIVRENTPPACTCKEVKHGESGNFKLDTRASYSAFKYCCFPHLRTFLYAKEGPVYLTHVERLPDVRELKRPFVGPELRDAGRALQLSSPERPNLSGV